MKGNMLILAPLCLLLGWMLPVGSKSIITEFTLNPGIKLDMAKEAVDDGYFDCNAKMEKLVKNKFFKEEIKGSFGKVWQKAERCANRNLEQIDEVDKALTKDHMQAICAYTSDYQQFYKTFNDAVRTSKNTYGTSFPFHSLHFWLTSAIQILKANQNCFTTYRRTKDVFTVSGDQIRFGSFTSTAKNPALTQFGKKTCFKIKTCFGAFLKKYSYLQDAEEEVLVPPYEVFKITKKTFVEGLTDCEVVYVLESVEKLSNLNCRLVK